MDSSPLNLRLCLLLAGAVLAAAVMPALAQAQTGGGKPILFSTPGSEMGTTNLPSLSAKPPVFSSFGNIVQAPPNFDEASQSAPLPAPAAPVVPTAVSSQLQRQLDERQNWMLLTPEEILGVPTPEKIMGISERDAAGQIKNETVAERFIERQESQSGAATNAFTEANLPTTWNLSGSPSLPFNPVYSTPEKIIPANETVMEQFLNGTSAGNNSSRSGNGDLNWPKLFSTPAPQPAPTPEQLEAAAEFQKLLAPHSSAPAAAATSPNGSIFSSIQMPSDLILGQTLLNPATAQAAPVSGNALLPADTTTLTGVPGQIPKPAQSSTPVWQPQLPPWMSSAPQLGVVPQRKF